MGCTIESDMSDLTELFAGRCNTEASREFPAKEETHIQADKLASKVFCHTVRQVVPLWLNSNACKHVVAPANWLANVTDSTDFIPDMWICS